MRPWHTAIVAALALSGCAGLTRTLPYAPIHDAHTGTLWVVEHDARSGQDDVVSVLVCHREASPACVRVNPQDVRSGPEYAAWLNSLPPEVRRLAQLPLGQGDGVQNAENTPAANP